MMWLRVERAAVLWVGRLAERYGSRRRLPRHLRVGMRGEMEALYYLRREGFTVVERRWRTPELNGDLDLIAWDGETLCFVEVKTRTARDKKPAKSAVDGSKQRMLVRMSVAYVRSLPRAVRETALRRYDVVSVYLLGEKVECELARDVFEDTFRTGGV